MSPRRPRLTTSTAVTIVKPRIIHSMYFVLLGASGSTRTPLKIEGSPISTIVVSIVTIRVASTVFESAIHLYPSPAATRAGRGADPVPVLLVAAAWRANRDIACPSLACTATLYERSRVPARGGP